MHAHWLPGLDDGAPNLEESLALLGRLHDMGYRRLWATPHVMADLYPNTSEMILEKLELVRQAVAQTDLDLQLGAAAEYLLDEAFGDKIKAGELLCLPGNQVLVEMSFVSPPPQLDNYIFQLQTKGYKVIIAHPERYLFYHNDFEQYKRFRDKGCVLQLNLLSLTGYYGKEVRDTAVKLLKGGFVDYLGTDLHHERHAEKLSSLLEDRSLNKLLAQHREQLLNANLV